MLLTFVYDDFSLYPQGSPAHTLGKCLQFQRFEIDKPPIMLQTEDNRAFKSTLKAATGGDEMHPTSSKAETSES